MPKIGAAHQTLFGILLILIIIYLPNGIAGDYRKLLRLFKPRGTSARQGAKVNSI
jgi:branched-chain amino acid transport system permease protein